MKKSFVLLVTLGFLVLLMLYMINIIENKTILSNIVKLKYLNLQAKIYQKKIKEYIQTHNDTDLTSFDLNDNRFDLKIIKVDENNQTFYKVKLKVKSEPIQKYLIIYKE